MSHQNLPKDQSAASSGADKARPRVLILGASSFQVPMIRYAKAQGAYVITCDYLPENPGHALADECHNVSTTDMAGVLELARGLGVDAVLTFASEPALQTVSFVAEKLGLPAPSLDSVEKLTDKSAFRRLLRQCHLPAPRTVTITEDVSPSEVLRLMQKNRIGIPCIVKPVDSSGSKGITVLDVTLDALPAALMHALAFSRSRHCIIEQYFEGDQIHGDGYLENGRLVFHYLGDHIFYTGSGSRIPISTRWPTRHSAQVVHDIVEQVEAISRGSGYRKGSVNIEARITDRGKIYIIEVSPRNGGNHVPIIIHHLAGFDFVRHTYLNATAPDSAAIVPSDDAKPGAYYVLHSPMDGTLEGVSMTDAVRPHIIHFESFKRPGMVVEAFRGTNATIGVALLSFSSIANRDTIMDAIAQHITPIVKPP
jgi:biotin carboxylase